MSIVILIPGILCIFALLRGNTRQVFVDFFIPVLVLLPLGYLLKLPHIPPIDFLTTVTLPLGIAMLFSDVLSVEDNANGSLDGGLHFQCVI